MADSEEENNHYNGFTFLIMVITLLAMSPTLFIKLVLYLLGFGPQGPVAGKYLQSFPILLRITDARL
jgi:ABC-type tungstate transport system substrate-binding protein